MITIGMLHYRKDPQTVYKSYAYAAAAKMEGVNFYYFTPGKVDLVNRKIKGFFYENGSWMERETEYPDVVYNAGGTLTAKQDIIVEALEKELPFTSHPIGDKMNVFYRIKKGGLFAGNLIPSEHFEKVPTAFSYLLKYHSIIIKPVSGAKGESIYFIKKRKDDFSLILAGTEHSLSEEQLIDWLVEILLEDEPYLIQPFIQSKTKQGLSYDFRLHVQKDGEGKWVFTTMFPRIAQKGIVANVSTGGYTSYAPSFLQEEFGDEYFNVKRYLETFAVQFSTHFDRLYDELLDELGIDVGIDKNQKLWIYEVNWRPGSPVLFYLEMDVVKRMIQYAIYLVNKKRKEG